MNKTLAEAVKYTINGPHTTLALAFMDKSAEHEKKLGDLKQLSAPDVMKILKVKDSNNILVEGYFSSWQLMLLQVSLLNRMLKVLPPDDYSLLNEIIRNSEDFAFEEAPQFLDDRFRKTFLCAQELYCSIWVAQQSEALMNQYLLSEREVPNE